jgi:hypothetical protein
MGLCSHDPINNLPKLELARCKICLHLQPWNERFLSCICEGFFRNNCANFDPKHQPQKNNIHRLSKRLQKTIIFQNMHWVFWNTDNELYGQILQFIQYCSYCQFEPNFHSIFCLLFIEWISNSHGHSLHFFDFCRGDSCNFRHAVEREIWIVWIRFKTIPGFLPPRFHGPDKCFNAHDEKT